MNKQTFKVLMDLSIFSSLNLQPLGLISDNVTINDNAKTSAINNTSRVLQNTCSSSYRFSKLTSEKHKH